MSELPGRAEPATAADAESSAAVTGEDTAPEEPETQPTLLEQMGGLSGLIYSSVPVLIFVLVNLIAHDLAVSIWASVGSAVAIAVWRLVRREPLQPAISGLFGVAICAFIAYRTGSAKGFFLFGIWTSLLYGGAFLLSAIVRWPLAGVIWSTLNGLGSSWRADRKCRRYYDIATIVWTVVFLARFVVQHWLYDANQVGWLTVARFGMGWPLAGLAMLATVWAVRKADLRQKELAETAEPAVV